MRYEIWDVATGNCVGRYASEEEATARIRNLLAQFGTSYADDLALTDEDDLGNLRATTTGAELIARARAALSPA